MDQPTYEAQCLHNNEAFAHIAAHGAHFDTHPELV